MSDAFQNLRYLIVNADDFGYTPGITRGIIRAHLEGIVTSTSVMVNMPDTEASVALAAAEAPRLGLGLHLTLTAGEPLSEVPGLVSDEGSFLHKNEMLRRLDSLPLGQVEQELRAQIARFEALAGRPPDHLDSHHHITYLDPHLFELMVSLAAELDVPIRRPLPVNREQALSLLASMGNMETREEAVQRLEALEEQQLDTVTTDHLNMGFYGRHTVLGDLLLHLVETPVGITELMCHPGELDAELEAKSGYTRYREQELDALTHRSARELLTSEGIVLITFRQLASVRA